MNRICQALLLTLASLAVGCSYDADTIRAEAPGGTRPQASTVPSSTYVLYHATQFDMWGVPQNPEKLASVEVPDNARVGFSYEVPAAEQFNPDGHSNLIAYAGPRYSRNLGPIRSMFEKYYWANPNEWDLYWSSRPERVIAKRATMY